MSRLGPDKAHIFRITHRDNVPWVLDNGMHCQNSTRRDPNFVSIGNPELIDWRTRRAVKLGPFGTLSDYVPFYFTPHSPMLLNIKTGYHGITRRSNEEIVIFVSSLYRLREIGARFVFTNRHAYLQNVDYFDDLAQLDQIDWSLLRNRDFRRDPEDPDKFARYEAEALVYRHLPLGGLIGVACYDTDTKALIDGHVADRGLALNVKTLPGWYF